MIRVHAAAVVLLLAAVPAQAADIDAMMTTAMKEAFDELLPQFERANGHVLRVTYGPSGALLRRFNGGEPADLFVTDVPALDQLVQQGKARSRLAASSSRAPASASA